MYVSLINLTQCYADKVENRNPVCPVCYDHLNELAEPLPFAHCSQSRLYCHISGLPLNENNQPMMLPNGHVYGEQVLYYYHCAFLQFDVCKITVLMRKC